MVSSYAKASADKKTIGYFFCISLNPTSPSLGSGFPSVTKRRNSTERALHNILCEPLADIPEAYIIYLPLIDHKVIATRWASKITFRLTKKRNSGILKYVNS